MLQRFRRWRFAAPEMEAEFQAQMDTLVAKAFYAWCVFSVVFFGFLLGICYTIARCTFFMVLPFILVLLLLLSLLALTLCVPASQRYLPVLLPWACAAILALLAWSAHGLVAQMMANARDLALVRTMALLDNDPEAETELVGYVRRVVSEKTWYLLLLVMEVNVDVLRMTGTVQNALHVHFTPLVSILMVTYLSSEISNQSLDALVMALIFMVHTLTSSLQMLVMFRERFRFDYQFRQQMAQEAKVMEVAKSVEVAQRQASQKADSMLNHILKNIMAEAHGCIDLHLGQHEGDGGCGDHLQQAQESLERGMRWCRKRQVMVQVNSGDYCPALAPTNLRLLMDTIVYGRDIAMDVPDVTVHLDALLCEVVLDNAISNAVRHGDPAFGPISLVVTTSPEKQLQLGLTFTLTNYVPDDHPPITPELVARWAAGGGGAGEPGGPGRADHLGLRHMFLAAAAHGMAASLAQVGNVVTFTASLETVRAAPRPAAPLEATTAAPAAPPGPAAFPPGLRVLCLDDSQIARLVLLHGFATHAPQTVCRAYGAAEEDVAAFEEAALSGADVVILDQHLDYPHGTVFGTDIAQQLRRRGYAGLVCVRSANTSEEDEAIYLRSGADCVLGKDLPLRSLVAGLQAAYQQFLQERPPGYTTGLSTEPTEQLHHVSEMGSLSFCSDPEA